MSVAPDGSLGSMLRDPVQFAHAIVKRGEAWSDAEAAASLLEETRKSVLAQEMAACGEMPVSKAEMHALASPVYRQHLVAMVAARHQANRAKVSYDGSRALMDLVRSAEATRRTEMGLR